MTNNALSITSTASNQTEMQRQSPNTIRFIILESILNIIKIYTAKTTDLCIMIIIKLH